MPVYSFGTESPLKFDVTEEFANAYNDAVDDFMNAQKAHKETTGKAWTPDEPLMLQHSTPEVFDAFVKILDDAQTSYGKPVHEEDIKDDYLIRN